MATLTSKLTLSSTALTSDTLSFSVQATPTVTNTTGLQRKTLTSTSRANQIFITDGDADVPDVTVMEGQYIDITDNHGLKKRYVFTDAGAGGAADGTIIVSNTDIGSTSTPASNLIGGICVQIADGEQQRDILEQLSVVIAHANGHNGSITCSAVAAEADGGQSTTLTNSVAGEAATFLIDNANSTYGHLHASTNSTSDHITLVNKNEYESPAFVYIKNTSDYHASNNRIFAYYDNHGAEEIMEIRGSHFAYVPLNPQNNLLAYTSTSGTVVEFMVVGTES